MKYSYNWLKELSGTKKTPKELAEMVGLKGFELEEIEDLGKKFDGFVVGKILEIKKHPDADKLQLVKIDIGKTSTTPQSPPRAGGEVLDIVCGAWNIKVGDKIPVALPGAVLPSNKLKIEKREVRGQVSNGMLCAEDELGLGKDHGGIKILDSKAKVGQPLAKVLGLDDSVVDFDILPDRAHDCLSHVGMAREICAMSGTNFQFPISNLPHRQTIFQFSNKSQSASWRAKSEILNISIKDEKGCPRYIGAVLENVKIGQSPLWMQARLVACGMEPINNIVDITNYVMLEIGNPLHAFDFDKLESRIKNQESRKAKIVVRKAVKGEALELLDGTALELDENDLVIANGEKALALAGIKGGKFSGISSETSKIVLEAANFDGFGIRKTRQRHSLLTEAQARFEKGLSPVLAKVAMARAIELFEKYADAKLVQVLDVDKSKNKTQKLHLKIGAVEKLLGAKISEKELGSILKNLGFGVLKEKDKFSVEVPFWRLDIEGEADLVEEVGRIVGYEKIPEQAVNVPLEIAQENKQRTFEWKAREILAGLGLDEVVNYSFYDKKDAELSSRLDKHFEIENPLSRELSYLRTSLLGGICKNIKLNVKHFEKFSIFEIGKSYYFSGGKKPLEKVKVAGAFFGKNKKSEELFYQAKSKIENLIAKASFCDAVFLPLQNSQSGFFHPSRSAVVVCDGKEVGVFGQIGKISAKQYGLKEPVVLFELDVKDLLEVSFTGKKFSPLRRFPEVVRDLSMFVSSKTEAREIEKQIKKDGGEILKEVHFFDQFIEREGNKKSLACHLKFWDQNRTLENAEVDKIMEKIILGLEKSGVEVRK